MISQPIAPEVELQNLAQIPMFLVDPANFDLSQLQFYDDEPATEELFSLSDKSMFHKAAHHHHNKKEKKCGVWCHAVLEHLNHLVEARKKNIVRAFRKGDPRGQDEMAKVEKDF